MSKSAAPDVIVCGGGVIGSAIAYYLAEQGIGAHLIESHAIARAASGFAAGIISAPLVAEPRTPYERLQKLSFELHGHLAAELPAKSGIDYGYALCPMLNLAESDADERMLRSASKHLPTTGVPVRWVPAEEVPEVCPWIDRPVRGGLLNEKSAELDPRSFTEALLAAAKRNGATTRAGRVTGVQTRDGAVTGISVGTETLTAQKVVFAMGPWTRSVSEWLDVPVPVSPLKGQILRMRLSGGHHRVGFMDPEGNYLIPKRSGLVFAGTTEEEVGFDDSTTAEARSQIQRFAERHVSRAEGADVVEHTACLRPMSRDEMPIIGPVPGIEGAYLATGHGRSGILLATGTGKSMAELIAGGRSQCLDLAPFDPSRFVS